MSHNPYLLTSPSVFWEWSARASRGSECSLTLRPPRCPIVHACTLQGVLAQSLNAFFDVLDRYTLADLLHPKAKLVAIFGAANAAQ